MPENKNKSDSLPKRSLKNVSVTGAVKRYKPSKHYVFIIQVTYTDDTEYVIYRRYTDFYKFQTSLLDKFPIEAGDLKEPRIIPYLPGRRPFARDKRKLAEERQGDLDTYCRGLISLKDNISKSALVKEFFEAKPTDLEPGEDSRGVQKAKKKVGKSESPEQSEDGSLNDISGPMVLEHYQVIADYKPGDRTELALVKDQIIEVVEKSDNGWWMVQIEGKQGWAPATYLQPMDLDEEVDNPEPIYGGEPHVTLAAHVSQEADELSFEKGVILDVLHKHLDGWWVASYNGSVGYAPANYLQRYNDTHLVPTASVKARRHGVTKTHVPKRKTTLDPTLPKEDLSIYQSVQLGISRRDDASGSDEMRQLLLSADDEDTYEAIGHTNSVALDSEGQDNASGPVYGNCEETGGAEEDDSLYENQKPVTAVPTGIMPQRFDGDDGEYYSDVDNDNDEYVNMPDQNGIMRQADMPPVPPPKDYKPELPPKAVITPTLPPKQAKVRDQEDVNTNGNPEKQVRRKRKVKKSNGSPNLSGPPVSNHNSPSHSPVLRNEQKIANASNVLTNHNNGIANDSELLKKLEVRRRKNEQPSQAQEIPKHNTKPDVPIKTVTITPSTPKLPQRAGRQDDRPKPLPRTVHR